MSNEPSRRRFLTVIAQGSGAACVATLGVACGGGEGSSDEGGTGSTPTGTISAGNVSAIAASSLTAVSGNAVAIGRDSGGLYALSLICTHQGCDMSSQGSVAISGINCSCHDSNFDANGNVLSGPAHTALPHYKVTVSTAGEVTIDASTEVAATVRTAVA